MATKGKDKKIAGQISFDFFGEMETEVKLRKTKKLVKTKFAPKKTEWVTIKRFRKAVLNVKTNHLKLKRKVKRLPKRFK